MRSAQWIASLAARYYLNKPDVADLAAIKYPTLRSVFDAAMNELCFRLKLDYGYKLTSVNLELTNHCNLACVMCPVNNGEMTRPKQFMEEKLFMKIIDENPDLDFILPFQWGEPLLHQGFFDMVQYAADRGIRVMITTNGTKLTDGTIAKLVDSPLERVTFSIDGNAETHTRIRGFAYEQLRENILRLKHHRDTRRSPLKIDVSCVVFEDTLEATEEFLETWRPLVDRVQLIPRLIPGPRTHRCRELWRGTMVVLSDGRVSICCADYDGEAIVGNAWEQGLEEIWNGPNMREIRRQHNRHDFQGICEICQEFHSDAVAPRFR